MQWHGRDEAAIILRGTTLLDVRIHPLVCVGSTHISVTGEPVQAYLPKLSADCSGMSYDLYLSAALHRTTALCEN